MASVDLTGLWLHDANDPSVYVQARLHGFDEDDATDAEVREYAGGRERIIAGEAETQSYSVTLNFLPRTDLEQLRAWKGQELMLRDSAGRLTYGTFTALKVGEYRHDRSLVSVQLQFKSITFDDTV